MQIDEAKSHTSLINLFVDAIKGPLLSSATQVLEKQAAFFVNPLANGPSCRSFGEARDLMQTNEAKSHTPLINLFADAVKGPLLSSATPSANQNIGFDLSFSIIRYQLWQQIQPLYKKIERIMFSKYSDYQETGILWFFPASRF